MPQLLRDTKVEVKNGELIISINLDLNINLNANKISIEEQKDELKKDKELENKWELPNFKSGERLKFGKAEE